MALLAMICFVVSLALPAHLMSNEPRVTGIGAALGAIPIGIIAIFKGVTDAPGLKGAIGGFYFMLCGLTNNVFLYSCTIILRRLSTRHIRLMQWCMSASAAIAWSYGMTITDDYNSPGIGWLLWSIAQTLAACMVWLIPNGGAMRETD
jgi:hypothetical protein